MQSAQSGIQGLASAASTATSGNKTFYEGVEQAGLFASGSERGIRRMELAVGAMAAQSIGAAGALGTLTEGLLLFSGGSALALGALGAIAAIAGSWHLATSGLAEFNKENEKLAKGFEAAEGPTARHRIAIADLRERYAELQERITQVRSPLQNLVEVLSHPLSSSNPLWDPNNTTRILDATQAATLLSTILVDQQTIMEESRKKADDLAAANARIFLPVFEAQAKLREFHAQFGTGEKGPAFQSDADIRREAAIRAIESGKGPADQKRAADAAVQTAHLERQLTLAEQITKAEREMAEIGLRQVDASEKAVKQLQLQNAEVTANQAAVARTGHSGEAFWSDADIARVERMKLEMAGIVINQQQIIDLTIQHAHAERDLAEAEEAARKAARLITEETRRQMQEMESIGRGAIHSLVDGLMHGTLDLGKIVESIIGKFVEDNITKALFGALGIASPSKVGIEAGQYVAQGLALGITGTPAMQSLGDLRLRLDVNTGSMPAAMTPFDAARDAGWQRIFRESSLVANQGGFRVPA